MASRKDSIPASSHSMREAETLALVLEGRHGIHAAEIADFFAAFHGEHGDKNRASAWQVVADIVRRRETSRVSRRQLAI